MFSYILYIIFSEWMSLSLVIVFVGWIPSIFGAGALVRPPPPTCTPPPAGFPVVDRGGELNIPPDEEEDCDDGLLPVGRFVCRRFLSSSSSSEKSNKSNPSNESPSPRDPSPSSRLLLCAGERWCGVCICGMENVFTGESKELMGLF